MNRKSNKFYTLNNNDYFILEFVENEKTGEIQAYAVAHDLTLEQMKEVLFVCEELEEYEAAAVLRDKINAHD